MERVMKEAANAYDFDRGSVIRDAFMELKVSL